MKFLQNNPRKTRMAVNYTNQEKSALKQQKKNLPTVVFCSLNLMLKSVK